MAFDLSARYRLSTFWNGQAQQHNDYQYLKNYIAENGSFNVIIPDKVTIKVFNPELALLFTMQQLQVLNLDTKQETTLNPYAEILPVYIAGYQTGCNYFDTEFAVSRDTLYGPRAEEYIADLSSNYFGFDTNTDAWNHVRTSYPLLFTAETIRAFGYYSGIVAKVDALRLKYPVAFQYFDEYNPTQATADQDTPPFAIPAITYNSKTVEVIPTKSQILQKQLENLNFFELDRVKALTAENQNKLIEMVADSKLPYQIAMFDYLQFSLYLERNYYNSKRQLYKQLSSLLKSDKDGRAVKGNMNSLSERTTEDNKKRYTAYLHKEKVIKDYQNLK